MNLSGVSSLIHPFEFIQSGNDYPNPVVSEAVHPLRLG